MSYTYNSLLVSGPELVPEDYEFTQRSVRQGKMHFGHLILLKYSWNVLQ